MPLPRPALEDGRAVYLNRSPIGRLNIEVIPPDPKGTLVAHRLSDQELGNDPARGVVAQIDERPAPKIRDRDIEAPEALAAVEGTAGEGFSKLGLPLALSQAQLTLKSTAAGDER